MKLFYYLSFLSLVLTLTLAGCEENADDDLNKGQACLDTATTSSEATNCLSYVEGKSGEKAARIRCGIYFLINDLTQQDMIDAFKQAETDQATVAPAMAMANLLALGGANPLAAHLTDAEELISICSEANSAGLSLVAEASYLGTLVRVSANANCSGDPNDTTCGLNNLSPAEEASLGARGNSIYGQRCNENSNDEICKCLRDSGAGSLSNAALGAALVTALQSNSCGE